MPSNCASYGLVYSRCGTLGGTLGWPFCFAIDNHSMNGVRNLHDPLARVPAELGAEHGSLLAQEHAA